MRPPSRPRACSQLNPGSARGLTGHTAPASAASTGPCAPRRYHPLPPGHAAALHGALRTTPHPRARSPHNPGPARGSTWRTALHQPRLFWTLCPPTSLSVNPRPPLPPYAAPRARPRTSKGSLSINRGSAGGLAWSTTPDPRGIHWTLCAPTSPPVASRPHFLLYTAPCARPCASVGLSTVRLGVRGPPADQLDALPPSAPLHRVHVFPRRHHPAPPVTLDGALRTPLALAPPVARSSHNPGSARGPTGHTTFHQRRPPLDPASPPVLPGHVAAPIRRCVHVLEQPLGSLTAQPGFSLRDQPGTLPSVSAPPHRGPCVRPCSSTLPHVVAASSAARCLPATSLLYTELCARPHTQGLAHRTTRARPADRLGGLPSISLASSGPCVPQRPYLSTPGHHCHPTRCHAPAPAHPTARSAQTGARPADWPGARPLTRAASTGPCVPLRHHPLPPGHRGTSFASHEIAIASSSSDLASQPAPAWTLLLPTNFLSHGIIPYPAQLLRAQISGQHARRFFTHFCGWWH